MFSLLLLLLPQAPAQTPADGQPQPKVTVEAQEQEPVSDRAKDWWSSLDKKQRREILDRHRRMQEMPTDAREELKRRTRAIDDTLQRMVDNMSPAEQAEFNAIPPDQRRRHIRQRMRHSFEKHEQSLRQHNPFPSPSGVPMHQRLRHSRRFIEKHRAESMQIQFDQLVADGWIAPRIADALAGDALELRVVVAKEATKWRTWNHASHSGWFKQWSLEQGQRLRLGLLPAPEFMHAMSRLRAGDSFEKAIMHNGQYNDASPRRPDEHPRRPSRMDPGRF